MASGRPGHSVHLRYLKFLKCHCNSTRLSAHRLEDGRFRRIRAVGHESIDDVGMLACERCLAVYPVENGILHMLPPTLYEFAYDDFYARYNHLFSRPFSTKANGGPSDNRTVPCDCIKEKISEMGTRDRQAEEYHTYGNPFHGEVETQCFRKFLKLSRDDTVLEVGCGTGRITKVLSEEEFGNYIALDFSEKSLRLLRSGLDEDVVSQVLFIKGDVCHLPLRDEIADKVISAQVLQHIPGIQEQRRKAQEIQRVLSPNGIAALTVYNYSLRKRLDRSMPKSGYHGGTIYYEHFSIGEIRNLFKPFLATKMIRGINCHIPFVGRFSTETQRCVESLVSPTVLSPFLGNLMFVALVRR